MKRALITGITGQDGSYLAEFLLEKGYEVHGIVRRASVSNTGRINHLIARNAIVLHDGDLLDSSSIIRIVAEVRPDEQLRRSSRQGLRCRRMGTGRIEKVVARDEVEPGILPQGKGLWRLGIPAQPVPA